MLFRSGKSKSTVHRIIQDAARKGGGVPTGQMGQAGQKGQSESSPLSPMPQTSQVSCCPDGTGTIGKEKKEGVEDTTFIQAMEVKIDIDGLREDPLREEFYQDGKPPF